MDIKGELFSIGAIPSINPHVFQVFETTSNNNLIFIWPSWCFDLGMQSDLFLLAIVVVAELNLAGNGFARSGDLADHFNF